MRFGKKHGTWELHPCEPPTWGEIAKHTQMEEAVLGNVWRCRCGRRWKLQQVEITSTLTGDVIHRAVSYTEVLDLTDDDIDEMEAFANSPNGQEFWG